MSIADHPNEDAFTGPRPTFALRNYTLAGLVKFAYQLHDFELIGGPEWARKDLFQITAKPASADDEHGRSMLRSLLEERFRLVLREQVREMRFYSLVLARKDGRLGPELTRCDDQKTPRPPQPRTTINRRPGSVPLSAWCLPISSMIYTSAEVMGAPVVDRTGLSGLWSYFLLYAPPYMLDSPDVRDVPPLEIALREQFGLKLDPQRGPMKVQLIESVQPPTENGSPIANRSVGERESNNAIAENRKAIKHQTSKDRSRVRKRRHHRPVIARAELPQDDARGGAFSE